MALISSPLEESPSSGKICVSNDISPVSITCEESSVFTHQKDAAPASNHQEESPSLEKTAASTPQEVTATASDHHEENPSLEKTVVSIHREDTPTLEPAQQDPEIIVNLAKEKNSFKCEYCDFECTEQKAMMAHTLSNHEIEKCTEHKCNRCEKVFVEACQLEDHVK